MKKILDELKTEIADLIQKQLDKVKSAEKASEVEAVYDYFDLDFLEEAEAVGRKLKKGKRFITDEELNKYFDQKV